MHKFYPKLQLNLNAIVLERNLQEVFYPLVLLKLKQLSMKTKNVIQHAISVGLNITLLKVI